MANIMIFDTETTSLEKRFCYNIGYRIVDTDTWKSLLDRDFVCEQVWHNPMLFTTAYYADKRDLYVSRMRGKTATMMKYGFICQQMLRDIEKYDVVGAYAYNSPFDEGTFAFNCDWFKCNNPFDDVPIFDIRGYAHRFLVDDNFKAWCERTEAFTESGNYSTTAETMFRYISLNDDFEEEHTALADSIIETELLKMCVDRGATLGTDYKTFKSVKREQPQRFVVKGKDNKILLDEVCKGFTHYKNKGYIKLK